MIMKNKFFYFHLIANICSVFVVSVEHLKTLFSGEALMSQNEKRWNVIVVILYTFIKLNRIAHTQKSLIKNTWDETCEQ